MLLLYRANTDTTIALKTRMWNAETKIGGKIRFSLFSFHNSPGWNGIHSKRTTIHRFGSLFSFIIARLLHAFSDFHFETGFPALAFRFHLKTLCASISLSYYYNHVQKDHGRMKTLIPTIGRAIRTEQTRKSLI